MARKNRKELPSLDWVFDISDQLEKQGLPFVLGVGYGNKTMVFADMKTIDPELGLDMFEEALRKTLNIEDGED